MSKNKKIIFSFDPKMLGNGEVVYCWQPGDRLLAFCGENRIISIVDKMGEKFKDFPLKSTGKCKYMEFDNVDGDTLAVFQDKCSIVTIINIFTGKKLDLEINRSNKDLPTCLKWAKNNTTLFIGTKNGMIYFYNKKNDKITPVTMSHSSQIVSADWNEQGHLVTGDKKNTISVTTAKGEALLQNNVIKYEPKDIKWARQKTNENTKEYNSISTIQNNKTILIYDINKKTNPIELEVINKINKTCT